MQPGWLDEAHVARRAAALEAAIAGEADYDIEYPIAGTDRWVQSRGSLVRSRSGRPLKLAGIVTDQSGRVLTFALISNNAGPEGRTALDALAAAFRSCGCGT